MVVRYYCDMISLFCGWCLYNVCFMLGVWSVGEVLGVVLFLRAVILGIGCFCGLEVMRLFRCGLVADLMLVVVIWWYFGLGLCWVYWYLVCWLDLVWLLLFDLV